MDAALAKRLNNWIPRKPDETQEQWEKQLKEHLTDISSMLMHGCDFDGGLPSLLNLAEFFEWAGV